MKLYLLIAWFVVCSATSVALADDDALATQAVQLIRAKCVSCHGAETAEGGLRLDSRELMMKGGDRGPAVVDSRADQSLIFRCVAGLTDEELRMPPKNPLSQAEISLLKRWLDSGALWSDAKATAMHDSKANSIGAEPIGDAWTDSRNPIVKIFGGERLDLWSLKPIALPAIPDANGAWSHNPIDNFVAAHFAANGIALPSAADRHTLLRRIHFDLTGLPPTPELVKSFETSQDARDFEKLIDQLLGSEQFGMHWARMWLDVARYSDSNGFDWDEFRPQAYRYRDYVIRSFNLDKPYDQFVMEQLAGDEMLDGAPRDLVQQDQLIATGFLRMGPHDNAAGLFNEQDRSRDELMVDLVETTGGALLGMTLSCCRCHDHKFDPVSQADYFRMRACFAGVKFADDLPIDLADVQATANKHNGTIDERIDKLNKQKEQLFESIRERLKSEQSFSAAESPAEPSAVDSSTADAAVEPPSIPDKPAELKKLANDTEKKRLKKIETAIKQAEAEKHELTHAMLMVDDSQPAATFVLYQGDYKAPRNQVEPGVLSILDPNPLPPAQVTRTSSSGRRTALAQWITGKQNPLTARVMVNRVWQQLMGQGLVRTPGDFGLAGIPPENPQLLDWLAQRFIDDGWSVKRLVRMIMHSATYQQAASYAEPAEPLLYATRRPRRLTAEQLRDSMLAVSGLLTSKNAGPPEWPELPREVLEANPAFLDDNETKTKGWYPSPATQQNCRSIFLVQKRNTRVPLLETLDQPENSVPCQRRWSSIVAPQALSLLNSREALAAAKSFAARIESIGQSDSDRIEVAFLLALQRRPTPSEKSACQQLVSGAHLTELARVLLNVNEFAYID